MGLLKDVLLPLEPHMGRTSTYPKAHGRANVYIVDLSRTKYAHRGVFDRATNTWLATTHHIKSKLRRIINETIDSGFTTFYLAFDLHTITMPRMYFHDEKRLASKEKSPPIPANVIPMMSKEGAVPSCAQVIDHRIDLYIDYLREIILQDFPVEYPHCMFIYRTPLGITRSAYGAEMPPAMATFYADKLLRGVQRPTSEVDKLGLLCRRQLSDAAVIMLYSDDTDHRVINIQHNVYVVVNLSKPKTDKKLETELEIVLPHALYESICQQDPELVLSLAILVALSGTDTTIHPPRLIGKAAWAQYVATHVILGRMKKFVRIRLDEGYVELNLIALLYYLNEAYSQPKNRSKKKPYESTNEAEFAVLTACYTALYWLDIGELGDDLNPCPFGYVFTDAYSAHRKRGVGKFVGKRVARAQKIVQQPPFLRTADWLRGNDTHEYLFDVPDTVVPAEPRASPHRHFTAVLLRTRLRLPLEANKLHPDVPLAPDPVRVATNSKTTEGVALDDYASDASTVSSW